MIKTINLNKIYNSGKPNQIHAINNISIDFPKTGFVSLLGPSGCGKTTLLNAISGLDKVKSGTIIVDNQEIRKYNFNKWDDIRTKKIGYIFQNYLLLPDLSVYQNLELVLKMLNVPNDKIEERIEYALKAVKMERFRKRKASQLSGGQMQRVAIARALVKSPRVIIADEPTGNLDETNTTQIMNILRKISRECLVILVTHEPRLANFYSDRIIKLADGKVIEDFENKNSNSFEFSEDRNIYLKEYKKEEVNEENISIEYFYKNKPKDTNIKIIYENDTIYISADSDKAKIKFIDAGNEIKIIDTKKPNVKIEDFDELDYHLEKLPENGVKSAIKFKEAFKMGINHLLSFTKKQKLFLFAFAFIAIFIVISAVQFSSFYIVDESSYIHNDKNIVLIDHKNENVNYQKLMLLKEEIEIAGYIGEECTPYNCFYGIKTDFFYQTKENFSTFSAGNIALLENLKSNKIIYGSLPTDYKGIVIDKKLLDVMMKDDLTYTGLVNYEDLIGQRINFSSFAEIFYNIYDENFEQFPIVIAAISDTNRPLLYLDKELLYTVELFANKQIYLTSNTIRLPEIALEDNEIYLTDSFTLTYPIGSNYILEEKSFVVKGHFSPNSTTELCSYVVNDKVLEEIYINYLLNNVSNRYYRGITFYTENLNVAKQKLTEEEIAFTMPYEKDIKSFNESRAISVMSALITLIIMLVISSLLLYFLMRSSLMLRINQVGIYRAIGAKRRDMYKIFFSEIVLITSCSSLIGFLIISYIIQSLSKNVLFSESINYPWYVALLTIIFIYLVNSLMGLLPIYRLMRLTPTQIVTKYDI
ncbi:MAG: ATP-binding cassette domain-containing protein [Bacilli bacterium]